MQELAQLALTAGMEVVGQTEQYLDAINPATYIGQGKVEELELWRRELAYEVLVFDDELSPRQQRNLEEAFDETVKVLDRTALILDIFAQHARTREGALQVELAQYEYRLPRLTRAWTHLARQAGGAAGRGGAGGVGLRGPGETQLEVDRRAVRERIAQRREERARRRWIPVAGLLKCCRDWLRHARGRGPFRRHFKDADDVPDARIVQIVHQGVVGAKVPGVVGGFQARPVEVEALPP